MGCNCGGKKKVLTLFSNSTTYVEGGFYFIDLCSGYRLKYKTNVFYLVNGDDIYLTTEDEVRQWAKDNCDGLEL